MLANWKIASHFASMVEPSNGVLAVLKLRGWSGCHSEFRLEVVGSKGRCSLGWSTFI